MITVKPVCLSFWLLIHLLGIFSYGRAGHLANRPIDLPADSLQMALEQLVQQTATQGKCRFMLKVATRQGIRQIGYDGRMGTHITDFGQPVEIGSCSKLYTATAIHQLVESGFFGYQSRLVDVLDHVRDLGDVWQKPGVNYLDSIRIIHLLGHTSGLPDYFISPDTLAIQVFGDSSLRYSPWQLLRLAKRLNKPSGIPGERFSYSNSNYILLGLIIQQYSRMPYQQYIRKQILQPLGLSNTWFLTQDAPKGLASGHYQSKSVEIPGTLAWSAGEMVTTLDDLLAFVQQWYTGKCYKHAATQQMLLSSSFSNMGLDIHYGLGLLDISGVSFGHAGQTFGFGTYAAALANGTAFVLSVDDAAVGTWMPAINISKLLAKLA